MKIATITAEKMVFGGDCISRIDGKTVFVPLAIPGEKLEVEITQDAGDYYKARILNVLEPSPYRTIPFCPLYGKCGGCNMQHITNEYQTELRKSILKDAFAREGVEVPQIEVVSAAPTGYRSRFQFHDGGLMERASNNSIKLTACPCATPEINRYLSEVAPEERPAGRVHVFGSSRITSIPEGYDKIIIADEPLEKQVQKEQKRQLRTPGGRKIGKYKEIKKRWAGAAENPRNTCSVNLYGKEISFDVLGFFQSNLEVTEKAVPLVTGGLSGKNVLDMYSGAGTFSVFLADSFENVTLVEHNKAALIYAEKNMAGKPHESFGVSGDVWIKYHAQNCEQRFGKYDAVVIDPPRQGMEKSVCQWLQTSEIPHIRSLSCDTATHARDAKFLTRSGYKLEKLFLLDFYPQTGHIESLAWFEKD